MVVRFVMRMCWNMNGRCHKRLYMYTLLQHVKRYTGSTKVVIYVMKVNWKMLLEDDMKTIDYQNITYDMGSRTPMQYDMTANWIIFMEDVTHTLWKRLHDGCNTCSENTAWRMFIMEDVTKLYFSYVVSEHYT